FPLDAPAIVLAAAGAALTFFGVGHLGVGGTIGWTSPLVWLPTALGVLAIAALITYQFHHQQSLMPVKPIATTFPLIGIIAGVLGGAGYTALLELLLLYLTRVRGYSPIGLSLVLWPGVAAAVVAALVFGKLFSTRYLLLLPLLGVTSLIAAGWILSTTTISSGSGEALWIAGMLGFGAGVTVAPALFLAGLSVQPNLVGRAFALVELLRLAGAFALVPAFTYFATIYGMRPEQLMLGLHLMYWVVLIGLVATVAICAAIFLLGGARIHAPNLNAYINEGQPALESPEAPREHDERPPIGEQLRSAYNNTLLRGEEGRRGAGPRSRRDVERDETAEPRDGLPASD
ncbi:MAG: hypothetical protein ACRDHE_09455, partial [Ktedonobacterales bacterium]